MQQPYVPSFSRGFFPGAVRFLVLALTLMPSAGVASAQTFAYIANQVSNNVLVYDASTYAPVTTVPVGLFPRYIGRHRIRRSCT